MNPGDYLAQVTDAKNYIISKIPLTPALALVLGTGLSGFVDVLTNKTVIPFDSIPNFPKSTAPTHKGEFIVGYYGQKSVICLNGRAHYYEGYDMSEVTFAIRLLGMLKINKILLTNASGGTREDLYGGDIVFITDHINLFPENPLRGPNIDSWGERFPDMSEVYSKRGIEIGASVCADIDIPFKTGVYVGLQGPNLETPAEYQFAHRIGGDMVGMSTIPEVIVARHMNIEVTAISLVTNACYPPERVIKTTLEDVVHLAKSKEPVFTKLISQMVRHL